MSHACHLLAELDCAAVTGDADAAALARFHEHHPEGSPLSVEDVVQGDAIAKHYAKTHAA